MVDGRLQVTISMAAIGKVRLNRSDSWKDKEGNFKRKAVRKWYAYKDTLRDIIQRTGVDISESNLLHIEARFAVPPSYSKKKRADVLFRLHDKKPDTDNIAKGVMDTLFENDQQIGDLHVRKLWDNQNILILTFGKWYGTVRTL